MKGQKKLLEFLADMGLPLAQCKQKFSAMEVHYRENLKQWIDDSSRKFGLDDVTYGSFVAQFGYKNKLCASDIVYCTTALIETPVSIMPFTISYSHMTFSQSCCLNKVMY